MEAAASTWRAITMDLEFDRTADDLVAFNLYYLEHSPNARREALTSRLLISVLAAWFAGGSYLFTPRYFNWVVLGATLAAGLVVFLVYPFFSRRMTIGRIRTALMEGNNESLFGHQAVAISAEGIFAKNAGSESKIRWSAVQPLREGAEHFYLFMSATNALIIPKRCFKADEARDEFARLVESYRRGG
jgi:hypothetical protein